MPPDGPLAVISADWGQSRATARGGALQMDLHSTLTLRNTGPRRLRGVSLLVLAQEVTPGGKGSVTVPSLDVGPGETFPIRVDLRLMRPLAAPGAALVEVNLDGVLYEDLTFFGPNRLQSRRVMLAWELEARRDRRALASALQSGGPEAVRKQMLTALARMADQPRLDVQLARGRATNVEASREVQFAFLQTPDAPVELTSGTVTVSGNEARAPRIDVVNRSKRPVRFLEIGWLVRDAAGREYAAGGVPAELTLAPGQPGSVSKETGLRFSRSGAGPVPVAGLRGFVTLVEFGDGEVWVPAQSPAGLSGEMQRLAELYRSRGLDRVLDQIRRVR